MVHVPDTPGSNAFLQTLLDECNSIVEHAKNMMEIILFSCNAFLSALASLLNQVEVWGTMTRATKIAESFYTLICGRVLGSGLTLEEITANRSPQ